MHQGKDGNRKDLLDDYSPFRVGKILPTTTKVKPNAYDVFRPKRNKCIDYSISEMYATLQAGDTRINVKDTHATYTPMPTEDYQVCLIREREARIKHFSGGPPQWRFIDELWRDKQERRQKQYRRQLKQYVVRRKKKVTTSKSGKHEELLEMVGPEWYQELSPKQLAAVDDLQHCMNQDLIEDSIIHTQENIASLGLVLRPTRLHIALALFQSDGNPVEFLLILYQLINPHRQCYSINDRLLLSAVVHLTITETLREMHVRIPSPPRREIQEGKRAEKKVKMTYESPYLEPLTIEPLPPKYSGIYYNKHIQHPESRYFSYLDYFRMDSIPDDIEELMYCEELSPRERQLIVEYVEAQKFYNRLPGTKTMLRLLKPTILNLAVDDDDSKTIVLPEKYPIPDLAKIEKLPDDDEYACPCGKIYPKQTPIDPNQCCMPTEKDCQCFEEAEKFYSKICKCPKCEERKQNENMVCVVGGVVESRCDQIVPHITGITSVKPCDCLDKFRDRVVGAHARRTLLRTEQKFTIGGLTLSPRSGPAYNLLTINEERRIRPAIISDEYQEALQKAQEQLSANKNKYVVSGIVITADGPVYVMSTVIREKPIVCDCLERHKYKKKMQRRQKELVGSEVKYVLGGIALTKNGPVFIISAVILSGRPEDMFRKPCKCQAKMEKRKAEERRLSLRANKKSKTSKRHRQSKDTEVKTVKSGKTCSCCHDYGSSSSTSDSDEDSETTSSTPISSSTKSSSTIITSTEDEATGSRTIIICEKERSNISVSPISIKKEKNEDEEEEEAEGDDEMEDVTGNVKNGCTGCPRIKEPEDFKPPPDNDEQTGIIIEGNNPDQLQVTIDDDSCQCKEELEVLLKHKCECALCNEARMQREATYIIGGGAVTQAGDFTQILDGVHQKQCSCMHEHLERIRQMEEYRRRVKARFDLRRQRNKFAIAGVQNTPDGPCYLISGMRPPVECDCAKALREKEEEERRLAQMAKMPNTGRTKYAIQGVREVPGGENVYIFSSALQTGECKCMTLLNEYETEHATCLKEYKQFLEQIQTETKLYLDEQNEEMTIQETTFESDLDTATIQEPKKDQITEFKETEDVKSSPQVVEAEKPEPASTNPDKKTKSSSSSPSSSSCSCGRAASTTSKVSVCYTKPAEVAKKRGVCCRQPPPQLTAKPSTPRCQCAPCKPKRDERPVKPIRIPPLKKPEDYESKRFFIYHTLPKDYKKQLVLLKKVLAGMHDDGWTLAKLPESYKLPHFKLWMQMRLGVYWTQSDRWKYVEKSLSYWDHTDICYRQLDIPNLPVSRIEAKKLTWKHAANVKKMIGDTYEKFYRNLKHFTIDSGREFFPPSYDYEFPTKTFRDCYFAYLPAKEEEVFPYNVVKPSDVRVIMNKYQCYC